MKSTMAILVVAGFALAGCESEQTTAQPAAEMHKLTVDELRAEFAIPHTTYAAGSYGPKTSVSYVADGKIRMRSPQINDTGTYRITDDGQYCSKFTTVRGGLETCQTIYQVGDGKYESHCRMGQSSRR